MCISTLVWKTSRLAKRPRLMTLVEQCAWHGVGTYLAQVTEKRIIVDRLQASFVLFEIFYDDVNEWYRNARVHSLNISAAELESSTIRLRTCRQYEKDKNLLYLHLTESLKDATKKPEVGKLRTNSYSAILKATSMQQAKVQIDILKSRNARWPSEQNR
uniref:Uncharacterized protein n=1 Tax=Parascaris equorum TaxID=6256 RepID=A0A914S2H8_PAREQ